MKRKYLGEDEHPHVQIKNIKKTVYRVSIDRYRN